MPMDWKNKVTEAPLTGGHWQMKVADWQNKPGLWKITPNPLK
jgi:hypothetical protein